MINIIYISLSLRPQTCSKRRVSTTTSKGVSGEELIINQGSSINYYVTAHWHRNLIDEFDFNYGLILLLICFVAVYLP